MDGFERVYYPGELEAAEEAERTEKGIPIGKETREKFLQSLRDHNIKIRENVLI